MNRTSSICNINKNVMFSSTSFAQGFILPLVQPKVQLRPKISKISQKQAINNFQRKKLSQNQLAQSLPVQNSQQFMRKTIVTLAQYEQVSSDAEVEYF